VAAKKPPPKRPTGRKGYYAGGPVISNNSLGNSIIGGFNAVAGMGKLLKDISDDDKKDKSKDPNAPVPSDTSTDAVGQGLYSRGGRIRSTSGPKIGKDDGLIPAQKGEYVVRKSAVNKLGSKVLGQINKGHLPRKGAR
jgi:hypothetical protein